MAEENNKPVFDEEPLAKLLEAAYVLQEHNRELQHLELNLERQREQMDVQGRAAIDPSTVASGSRPTRARGGDYTRTLAQIVEAQHQIQARHLNVNDTITFVGERIVEIASAGGCAIGILEGKTLFYRAAAGSMTPSAGSQVTMEKALCVASLRTGQVIRCPDVSTEFLLDVDECRRRGIQSMIAVPVYHEDNVVGGLELYYASPNAFLEQDVHTCQLMAGLITESLVRNKEIGLKKSVTEELVVMLQAMEKLKANSAPNVDLHVSRAPSKTIEDASPLPATSLTCRKCGNALTEEEQFCGKCGTPWSAEYEPTMQSKVAQLWQMQEARKKGATAEVSPSTKIDDPFAPEKTLADSIEEEMPELFVAPELRTPQESDQRENAKSSEREVETVETAPRGMEETVNEPAQLAPNESEYEEGPATEETALAKAEPWTSAASARAFLEQAKDAKPPGSVRRFWQSRRGDIYLGVALLLLVAVLRWGIWSSHPVNATNGRPNTAGHHKVDPTADLSFFDRMLISLGLAEAPTVPEDKGDPGTQVWVDLQTGLYYCPGTDLYGKTPKGKYTGQRDAQLDQFEPAYRKACD